MSSFLRTDRDLSRNSYYAATAQRGAAHPALQGSGSCDVAIVGGGLAGVSAAIELADRGFDVVVLEARQLGWGASGRNGGQAIHGLACEPQEIEAQLGRDDARRVWAMTLEALDLIHERCRRFDIDCDWQAGYLGLAVNARKAEALRHWRDHVESVYGYPLEWIEPQAMPKWIASPRFHSGIFDARSGHLHPLKYCLGLARAAASLGVRLHENTAVQGLEQQTQGSVVLRTTQGQLRARHVLLAGNVYLQGIAPQLEARIMPVGTYIGCTAPLGREKATALIPSRAAVCDTNFVLDYFRLTGDERLLFGGRVSYSTAAPRDLAATMQRRIAATFPQLSDARIDYAWGGFVDISLNRAPDFGRLADHSNVYYLQGFSGHGLALTGLAGKLVAEAIDGNAGRFDTFARLRHRPFPGGRLLRTPALVLACAYYRLRDML